MPRKRITTDEPVLSRPQRNMRAKKVFDPSDNYVSKKRNKSLSKSEKPIQASTSRKTIGDKKSNQDIKSKIHVKNELIDNSSNEVFNSSPESSPINSPVKSTSTEVSQDVGSSCSMCSKNLQRNESVNCPVCVTKVHKICLLVNEPIWKFKLDRCPWLCEQCRKNHCSKCLMDEAQWDVDCRCITCHVGLHRICYESYDIKPLHSLINERYVCIPCMTLGINRVPEEEEDEDMVKDLTRVSLLTSEEEDNDSKSFQSTLLQNPVKKSVSHKDNIPDVTSWDKNQLHAYLADRLPHNIAIKIIEKDIDGAALKLLQRKDITERMDLKLGPAMKLYKQVRILQTQSTHHSVYWE